MTFAAGFGCGVVVTAAVCRYLYVRRLVRVIDPDRAWWKP